MRAEGKRGKWCPDCGAFVRPTRADRCPRCGRSLRGWGLMALPYDHPEIKEEVIDEGP